MYLHKRTFFSWVQYIEKINSKINFHAFYLFDIFLNKIHRCIKARIWARNESKIDFTWQRLSAQHVFVNRSKENLLVKRKEEGKEKVDVECGTIEWILLTKDQCPIRMNGQSWTRRLMRALRKSKSMWVLPSELHTDLAPIAHALSVPRTSVADASLVQSSSSLRPPLSLTLLLSLSLSF